MIKYKEKLDILPLKAILRRVVINASLVIIVLLSFIFVPKAILTEDYLYKKAVSLAYVEEESDIALYDYKVYSTKERFDQGIIKDIEEMKIKFRDEEKVLLVRVPGVLETKYYTDYILDYDESVPYLNIEFYIVKNIKYKDKIVATDTVLSLANDISKKVNSIYYPLIIGLHALLALLFLRKFIISSRVLSKKLKVIDKNIYKERLHHQEVSKPIDEPIEQEEITTFDDKDNIDEEEKQEDELTIENLDEEKQEDELVSEDLEEDKNSSIDENDLNEVEDVNDESETLEKDEVTNDESNTLEDEDHDSMSEDSSNLSEDEEDNDSSDINKEGI